MENELALKVDNVKKRYRLGVIGGGTLQGDIQSWWARVRGKEDPNTKIGTTTDTKKGSFMALDGISFEVKKGERLGIIGGNGAGKSTTLKILSRVTAPTEGTVYINGRISSMLEVGTGFHPELTGRENIYLNGAILGMNKEEVDRKIEDIIDFSECRQFIDTPVKRYSSGMYVKLAFSVAAHLDSEILIMDEVLAVGDMKFQQKCLKKMREVAENEGRTVLYVSHNMNTIRQLCDRCIVLEKGKIIFDGNVEDSINSYLGIDSQWKKVVNILDSMRDPNLVRSLTKFERIDVKCDDGVLDFGEKLYFDIFIQNKEKEEKKVYIRIMLKTLDGTSVTMSACEKPILLKKLKTEKRSFCFNISNIVPGKYTISFVLFEIGEYGVTQNIDVLRELYTFSIKSDTGFNHDMSWNTQWWGHFTNGNLEEL